MRTVLIDCSFDLDTAMTCHFESLVSVFDYDVAMWDPQETINRLSGELSSRTYRGRPWLDSHRSMLLAEALERRRKELLEFLQLGKRLVVFAAPSQSLYIETGDHEITGTGRNRVQNPIVRTVDLLDALPLPYRSISGRGLELEPASASVRELWKETEDNWIYRCILEKFPGQPILKVAGLDKVVASLHLEDSGGVFALLPEPWIPDDEDDTADEGDNGLTGSPQVVNDEVSEGPAITVPQAIYSWVSSLGTADDHPLPDWCAEYLLPSESLRHKEQAEIEMSMRDLAVKLDRLKAAQIADDRWKRLVTGQGEALEQQVQAAFELLGFSVQSSIRGRSDLRLEHSGRRVVVEVKGVSKSAAEKHAAQLEKWVSEELAGGIKAKGILVVNAWKDVAPNLREATFPDQMIGYASARGHCLVAGAQLLNMCLRVMDNQGLAASFVEELLKTVGKLAGFSQFEAEVSANAVDASVQSASVPALK